MRQPIPAIDGKVLQHCVELILVIAGQRFNGKSDGLPEIRVFAATNRIGRNCPDAIFQLFAGDAFLFGDGGFEQMDGFLSDGAAMGKYSQLLTAAIRSMIDVTDERDIDSLFTRGPTTALTQAISGVDDFELVAFLAIVDGGHGDA